VAVTVTPNLTDVTLGESADDSYWTGEDGISTEVKRQGNSAQAWIVSKNSSETANFDCYSKSGLVDMSATGTHLYITMRCDIAPYFDYLRVALQSDTAHGSSSSGTYWWTIVDNTTNIEWFGEWKTFILDVNSTATDGDSSGTLDLAGITDVKINVDNSNSGSIRSIENTYIDCIRFGTGLTLTGTSWDWDDVAVIDQSSTYMWDIIRKVGPGIFEVNGALTIGNGSTSTTPAISNQTLFFPDKSTSGAAGGPLGKIASGIYKFILDGTATVCDFNNFSLIASANYPFYLDADYASLPSNSIDWDGGLIIRASAADFDDTQSLIGVSFVNCGQVNPSTCEFEGNTISGYSGTDGALLWPGGTTVANCNFNSNDRAIEITQSSNQTFDALFFSGNTYDVHLNNGGNSINVSKNNGSDPTSYVATGGGTVTFVGASVQTLVKVKDSSSGADIQGARVLVYVTDGTNFPYEDSVSITGSGTTATVSHTAHGLSTGDYVIIRHANENEYNGCYQITVTGVNGYTYTTNETITSSPATGSVTATFAFISGTTNSSGEVSDSRVVGADQPIAGRVRKSSGTPYYKTGNIFGTVDSTGGLSVTVALVKDE